MRRRWTRNCKNRRADAVMNEGKEWARGSIDLLIIRGIVVSGVTLLFSLFLALW